LDVVFLLDIDQRTIAARMQRAERGNDFDRVGGSLRPPAPGTGRSWPDGDGPVRAASTPPGRPPSPKTRC
jgi:hypothetical protein